MKKSAFTMIELVFIIVILGILAAIAVPKMAASREDAVIVAIRSDIATISEALPAYYMGQGELSRIDDAVVLESSTWWVKSDGKALHSRATHNGSYYTTGGSGKSCAIVELESAGGDQYVNIKLNKGEGAGNKCERLRKSYPSNLQNARYEGADYVEWKIYYGGFSVQM